jgi:hypothetical protein
MRSGYLLPTLFAAGCLGTQHGQTADHPTVDISFVSVTKVEKLPTVDGPFPTTFATSVDVEHAAGTGNFQITARNIVEQPNTIYQLSVFCAGGVLAVSVQDDPSLGRLSIIGMTMLEATPPTTVARFQFGGQAFRYAISDLCSPAR